MGAGGVVKLVMQFDDAEASPTVATPTCGGCCCCCCCCLASAVSTSAFSSMHLRSIALQQPPSEDPRPDPRGHRSAPVLGALAILLAVCFAVLAGSLAPVKGDAKAGVGAVAGAALWLAILVPLYRAVGARRAVLPAVATVVIGSAAAFVEFFVGAALLLSESPGAYVPAAFGASALAIFAMHRHLLGGRS